MSSRATFLLTALIASAVLGQETPESKAEEQSFRESSMLIDQLVLRKGDTYERDGSEYLSRASSRRINQAFERLVSLGESAWPALFAHLDDDRPTTATQSTSGPHLIRHKCYYILRRQIVSYPRGYPNSKLSPEYQLDRLFKPSIKDWLLERRDKSLTDIRIETLQHVIELEQRAAGANSTPTVVKLSRHLDQLMQKSKAAIP